jgi:hypothetical protein
MMMRDRARDLVRCETCYNSYGDMPWVSKQPTIEASGASADT